jgi:hypothetical protein
MRGSIRKRCPCPVTYSATGRRLACKKDHGSWYYVVDLGRGPDGKRRQERRGGYRTRDEAEEAMAAVIKTVGEGTHAHDGRLTVGEFLDASLPRSSCRWRSAATRAGHGRPPRLA